MSVIIVNGKGKLAKVVMAIVDGAEELHDDLWRDDEMVEHTDNYSSRPEVDLGAWRLMTSMLHVPEGLASALYDEIRRNEKYKKLESDDERHKWVSRTLKADLKLSKEEGHVLAGSRFARAFVIRAIHDSILRDPEGTNVVCTFEAGRLAKMYNWMIRVVIAEVLFMLTYVIDEEGVMWR